MTNSHMTISHIRAITMDFNYFSYLCFGWAFVGILTRILMITLGDKWNKWEMDHAYAKKKPIWINIVGVFAVAIIAFTWYQVFNLDVDKSWIIAVITSLTLIKIFILIFNYDNFREFASKTLYNPRKKMKLNILVFLMSVVFILLGLFVY